LRFLNVATPLESRQDWITSGSNTSDKELNSVRRLIDVRARASESSIKKSDNSILISDFELF
jgi:hypothetical protein